MRERESTVCNGVDHGSPRRECLDFEILGRGLNTALAELTLRIFSEK